MVDKAESTFTRDGPDLFNKLEAATKAVNDAEYSALVIDPGIAEAKNLLRAGKATSLEQSQRWGDCWASCARPL